LDGGRVSRCVGFLQRRELMRKAILLLATMA
jgi:hypothetical protein